MKQIDWKTFYSTSEDELKKIINDNKLFTSKYLQVLSKLNKTEIKNLLFSEYYEFENFEGIATIITSCNQKDWDKLIKYIYSINLGALNIIRILLNTLDNISLYKGKFYFELCKFKTSYYEKLKKLLFELGGLNYIDKLDLINMFKVLIRG